MALVIIEGYAKPIPVALTVEQILTAIDEATLKMAESMKGKINSPEPEATGLLILPIADTFLGDKSEIPEAMELYIQADSVKAILSTAWDEDLEEEDPGKE